MRSSTMKSARRARTPIERITRKMLCITANPAIRLPFEVIHVAFATPSNVHLSLDLLQKFVEAIDDP